MDVLVLAPSDRMGRQWQYDVENLGADWRCTPVYDAGQALSLLAGWRDAVILLRCGESRELLRSLAAMPPLAPPWLLGVEMAAPDGQLCAPEELPHRLAAFREEGRLPAGAARHMPATADIASAFFRTMEMPRRLRAWEFLPEMAALTVVHPPLLADLRHGLYPMIARRHGMTAAGVERSLRLCVESTWMHGSLSALERFFGSSVDPEKGKPTNREFLCRVQERLTLTMKRLL